MSEIWEKKEGIRKELLRKHEKKYYKCDVASAGRNIDYRGERKTKRTSILMNYMVAAQLTKKTFIQHGADVVEERQIESERRAERQDQTRAREGPVGSKCGVNDDAGAEVLG